jgi:hypothetical protein
VASFFSSLFLKRPFLKARIRSSGLHFLFRLLHLLQQNPKRPSWNDYLDHQGRKREAHNHHSEEKSALGNRLIARHNRKHREHAKQETDSSQKLHPPDENQPGSKITDLLLHALFVILQSVAMKLSHQRREMQKAIGIG